MFRLVHISDLHLPLPEIPHWKELLGKRMIGYINWQSTRSQGMGSHILDILLEDIHSQKPDHIAITGDLVNISLMSEFWAARDKIMTLGEARNVSITFGNHDAYVPGAVTKATHIFKEWIYGIHAQQEEEIALPFPYLRMMAGCDPIAVIAASSAIAMPPFCAAGYFGQRQAYDLGQLLYTGKRIGAFRIVMIHHPPLKGATSFDKKLWGVNRFQKVIAEHGAELVLHGHTHIPSLSFLRGSKIFGKGGEVPVIGVASASQQQGGHKPPAGYNLFEISRNENQGDGYRRWYCRLIYRALNPYGRMETVRERVLPMSYSLQR